ncbi:MAG: hypothetical protein KDA51_20080 [Planctomycetales bacterium]|nr:hypothetical protein [Planctomycetales bacterium]
MSHITETLNQRGNRYGEFNRHAEITQNIKKAMQDSPNWATLKPWHREGLEMIAHKIGRILNGDPNYDDSWHDIAGYAQLVEQIVRPPAPPVPPAVPMQNPMRGAL